MSRCSFENKLSERARPVLQANNFIAALFLFCLVDIYKLLETGYIEHDHISLIHNLYACAQECLRFHLDFGDTVLDLR